MADISAAFRRPFPEQVAAFRRRLQELRPTARWNDLEGPQHDRAFMVAGAMQADLLADLAEAVDAAISDGETLQDFRARFDTITAKHGWRGFTGDGTKAGRAWRTRVIYRTNAATTYAAGRFAQLTEAGFAYWIYFHGGSLEPRVQHLGWNGIALAPDHPFWLKHYPPNGWGCSCYVIGAHSAAGVRRRGGDPDKTLPDGWDVVDPRTNAPSGIDKGWAHAPGRGVARDISVLAEKMTQLPGELSADLGQLNRQAIQAEWQRWVQSLETDTRTQRAMLGTLRREDIRPTQDILQMAITSELIVERGLIDGPKSRRHDEAGNALTQAEWLALAGIAQAPVLMAWDARSKRLMLYFVAAGDQFIQLSVLLNARRTLRKGGLTNQVRSAFKVPRKIVRDRLRGGELVAILGSVE